MKIAYILRGLPGSGKSTIAKNLAGYWGVICSTDDFFVDETGQYQFNPVKLKEYHIRNQNKFKNLCVEGFNTVICDNTNMARWEMKPYLDAAKENGYIVVEMIVGDPKNEEHQNVCAARNIHGVPLEVIKKMGRKFER